MIVDVLSIEDSPEYLIVKELLKVDNTIKVRRRAINQKYIVCIDEKVKDADARGCEVTLTFSDDILVTSGDLFIIDVLDSFDDLMG